MQNLWQLKKFFALVTLNFIIPYTTTVIIKSTEQGQSGGQVLCQVRGSKVRVPGVSLLDVRYLNLT